MRARRRPDARFGQHEKRCNRGHRDGHGDDGGTRARARDPQAETEHEERKGGDHVPLADVVEILDREERDLGDEQNDVGSRHCEERTCGGVLLAAHHRQNDERRGREQRQTECHRDDDPGMPRELRHRAARGSRRLRDLPVRPEQVASPGERNGHEGRGRQPDQGQDRRQPSHDRAGAPEPRVERDRDEQRGEQDERLQPYGGRDAHRQQEQALPLERRLLQHAGKREKGSRDERIEERFGHQQAAVPERGWQHGDRGSAERPARAHEPGSPEVDGDGDQRHRERLKGLRRCDARREVSRRQRKADESGCEQAVVRNRALSDGERARLPERLPDEAVDHLVRSDPGHVERACYEESSECGEEHDRAHRDRCALRHLPSPRAATSRQAPDRHLASTG